MNAVNVSPVIVVSISKYTKARCSSDNIDDECRGCGCGGGGGDDDGDDDDDEYLYAPLSPSFSVVGFSPLPPRDDGVWEDDLRRNDDALLLLLLLLLRRLLSAE